VTESECENLTINMKLCGKCGLRPSLRERGGPCQECEAAYQRQYKKLAAKKRERAAYFRGFEECRAMAISRFEGALFQGWEAAQTMRNLRAPM
jgi:hypothetical protein